MIQSGRQGSSAAITLVVSSTAPAHAPLGAARASDSALSGDALPFHSVGWPYKVTS